MPLYETVFLARQDISSQQVTSLTESFTNAVKEGGGEVPKTEYWGLRNLAYRIKKNRKAHYVLLNIDAPVAAVHEMERNLRINEDVIRYMTIKVDDLEEGASIMMRNKAAREERSRREERHRGARKETAEERGKATADETAEDAESEGADSRNGEEDQA